MCKCVSVLHLTLCVPNLVTLDSVSLTYHTEKHALHSLVITGRIAAKRQTAGIKFTQRLNISIFPP